MAFIQRPFALALVLALAPLAARADKLDKDDKKWLDQVKPIMLADEERTFRNLQEKKDREEFKSIFWARRDPEPATPENEFQAQYEKARAEADTRYRAGGRPGSQTDCGRVFLLLGEPAEVKQEANPEATTVGLRKPETWIYRGPRFGGGEARIDFDAECQLPQGARLGEQLESVARAKITRPELDYRTDDHGHIVKLTEQLHKASPALELLKAPRQDFRADTWSGFLRTQEGGTAVVGLVRGESGGLDVQEAAGKKTVKVAVAARALGEDGKVASVYQSDTTAEVQPDGSFVASYRLVLAPGKYTLSAGVVDPKNQKGSSVSAPLEVPNLNKGEVSFATLMLLDRVDQDVASDAKHPLAAFELGNHRLVPHFGTTFMANDAPMFFYQFYDAQVDPATGKRNAVATLSLMKDGKEVASSQPETFDGLVGANVVGPVPLKFGPGQYIVRLKVEDKVAKKEYVQEMPFDVKAPATASR
jgi:GWxTD domain-containing protein